MKTTKIFTLISILFIFSLSATQARNIPKKDEIKALSAVNDSLQRKVDSLLLEIDRYKAELELTDSLTTEVLDSYAERGAWTPAGISLEEYNIDVSDSLLTKWYCERMAGDKSKETYDLDTVRFHSNVPDSVYIDRIKKMNSFITLPYNDIVRNYIVLYSEKMPEKMSHIMALCSHYMPIFQEIFNRYDIPEELMAMAVIESAMDPLAVSPAGAKGMWQFMYSTAKMYGLHIDSFVDERLDPIKAAEAAAQYLLDSYDIFGDWNLAIASYNCGAGNVKKAIRRAGGSREFWDIWPYLPRETRGYVPAFVGALYAMKYHKEHGIKPKAMEIPVAVDTFRITKQLHLKQVHELTGAPLEQLKNLNPQYRHEIIPGDSREYILRLPYTYTNAFIEHEDSVYRHKADIYFNPATIKQIIDGGDGESITYVVKSGDYLGKIAGMYRVSVANIKKWNNLKSNNIRIGQRLKIYRSGRAPVTTTSSTISDANAKVEGNKITYTVQKGDVLGKISEKYKVSVADIKSWNGLKNNNIQIGQKLVIYSDGGPAGTDGEKITYTVKSGDVLGKIAEKYKVKIADIKSWNGLKNNNIRVGQKLIIYSNVKPTSSKASTASSTSSSSEKAKSHTNYTVKEGDSFYSIAKNYPGVSAQNIMDYNGIKSTNLKPGKVIKIPVY